MRKLTNLLIDIKKSNIDILKIKKLINYLWNNIESIDILIIIQKLIIFS